MAKLLDAQTTVAAGQATQMAGAHHTYQATVSGNVAFTAPTQAQPTSA